MAAIEELRQARVIVSCTVDKTTDPRNRNKLINAKITLTPDPHFVSEMKHANKRQADIDAQARILKLPGAGE